MLQSYDSIITEKSQPEIIELIDKTSDGKERPWKQKKIYNEVLASAYEMYSEVCPSVMRSAMKRKAELVRSCATFLEFTVVDGKKKLMAANFCRARLCPMCSWRRGLKLYGIARDILNEAYIREPQGKALLLTLTVRNCEASEIKRVIQRMSRAFSLMFRDSVSFRGIVGWIRNTEITHDIEMHITSDMYYGNKDKHIYSRKDYYEKNGLKIGDINPNYNLYHPHLHCLLFAGKDYFDKYYARQEQFQKDWVTYYGDDGIADIRRISLDGLAEVCKYVAKDSDYLKPDDMVATLMTVATLEEQLKGLRLVAYGGLLKTIKKDLNIGDIEGNDVDLVGADESSEASSDSPRIYYSWDTGLRAYKLD